MTSKSKECLERLFDDYEYLIEEYYPRSELIESQLNKTKNNVNKIIQDLDKLEKLEKENSKLKKVIEILKRYLKLKVETFINLDKTITYGLNYDTYCRTIDYEVYDLLKEYFGND